MRGRSVVNFAVAFACAASAPALAAYKCATRNGVTYQDKPCMEAPAQGEVITVAARDPRLGDRLSMRGRPEAEPDRRKVALDQRRAAEIIEYQEWLARAERKSDSLKSCASREVHCSPTSLRVAALYLSEAQLESALGSPDGTQMLGMERTSQWTVRVNDSGRLQSVKLVAAWGLCSDDRNYFASGQGQRACKISID